MRLQIITIVQIAFITVIKKDGRIIMIPAIDFHYVILATHFVQLLQQLAALAFAATSFIFAS
jgi:hypothetical protein